MPTRHEEQDSDTDKAQQHNTDFKALHAYCFIALQSAIADARSIGVHDISTRYVLDVTGLWV